MKKKVLDFNQLPARLPLFQTATILLIFDNYNIPEWLCGIICLFIAVSWCLNIYRIATEDRVSANELINPTTREGK